MSYLNAEQRESMGGPKAPPLMPLQVIDNLTAERDALAARLAALEPLARAVVRYHYRDGIDGSWQVVVSVLTDLDPALRAELEAGE